MARILVAVRDFLVILALSWIGVAVDSQDERKPKPAEGSKSVAAIAVSPDQCG
ncbi:MAG: hypothetical protein HXY28_15280 [Hydrogenophilaceae bacterium]|nr:hypothetical protein [Hydrogenophilaceae bacterium]